MLHIVTPFPFLLDWAFFAPLILRFTIGVYALAIGFSASRKDSKVIMTQTGNSTEISEVRPELTPLGTAYRALFIITGISFIIGLGVQISAIIMAALILVCMIHKPARLTNEISRVEMSLLLAISLSLLLSGAGPWAIDLPL